MHEHFHRKIVPTEWTEGGDGYEVVSNATNLVKFRFEIPDVFLVAAPQSKWNRVFDLLHSPGTTWEADFPLDKAVTVFVGTTTREVLAELGPMVESMWR